MNLIDTILEQVEALPSSPQILPKLLTALNDPDSDVSRIVDLIAYDPGLTTRVLQLCNSVAFGGAGRVSDVVEAVNRVGLQAIYRIVAAASGRLALQPRQVVPGLEPDVLWKHSVTTALAAQLIAQDQQDDVSAVFTAALLHDSGKIILAEAFPGAYGPMLGRHVTPTDGLCAEEEAAFGSNHATVGGRLLGHWKFPLPIALAVGFHHCPAEAGDASRLAAHVHLGNVVAHRLDAPAVEPDACAPATTDALKILHLPPTALTGYAERTLESFEFVNALCRI